MVRIALVIFVLAWIFGPRELRSAVPILLVFLFLQRYFVRGVVAGAIKG